MVKYVINRMRRVKENASYKRFDLFITTEIALKIVFTAIVFLYLYTLLLICSHNKVAQQVFNKLTSMEICMTQN